MIQSPAKKNSESHKVGLRSTGSVGFMGMRVSYIQYLKLKSIQRKVIQMDKLIRNTLEKHTLMELAGNPQWKGLIELYVIMKKILPEEYLQRQDHTYRRQTIFPRLL